MTTILRYLPTGPLWREVPHVEGYEPPVPVLTEQFLGLAGTMQDGTAPFGQCYRDLYDDGGLRADAMAYLAENVRNLCPDPLYSGPIFTSTEHLGPKPGEPGELRLAREWISLQYGLIQKMRPHATVFQYDIPRVTEPVAWPTQCRVRDLYQTQTSAPLESRVNLLRYAPGMVPLVNGSEAGQQVKPLDPVRRAMMMQVADLMASKCGELWVWCPAWDAKSLAMCRADMEWVVGWRDGVVASTPSPPVAA